MRIKDQEIMELQGKKLVTTGTLWHLSANMLFFLCSMATNIFLVRMLSMEEYGVYGLTMSLIVIVIALVHNGMLDTMGRLVASENEKYSSCILKKSLAIEAVISIALIVIIIFSADLFSRIFKTYQLSQCLIITSLSILIYGLGASYVGFLGGKRRFVIPALYIGLNAVLKMVFILIVLFTGLQLTGVMIAYVVSQIPGLFLVACACRQNSADTAKCSIQFQHYLVPLTLLHGIYILCQNIDLIMLQWFCGDEKSTGIYAATSTIAKIVTYFFVALNVTLLPSVSKAVSQDNIYLLQRYIRTGTRVLFLLMIPLAALLSVLSQEIVELLYSKAFSDSALPLSILVWGMAAFTFFTMFCAIITGTGKPRVSFILSVLMLVMQVVLNSVCIPQWRICGAASATTVTFFISAGLASGYIFLHFGPLFKISSVFRIIFAAGCVAYIAYTFPPHGWHLIYAVPVLLLLYSIVLVLLREINFQDFKTIQQIVGMNKNSA